MTYKTRLAWAHLVTRMSRFRHQTAIYNMLKDEYINPIKNQKPEYAKFDFFTFNLKACSGSNYLRRNLFEFMEDQLNADKQH